MRLDKFLKVSRLIRRRSVANDACSADRVNVNGKPAKPSKELKEGDILDILFGEKILTIEVLYLNPSPKKEQAQEMYRIVGEMPRK
ncbi:MAG: RNA-binding S4 domain-containing protein [Clostridiales bacterium]|jgi:ribosomal 50S subunit-recycling heat shock protein|nr:RNA-binding S4 domain-containing protein [Clostridiales bacterium]